LQQIMIRNYYRTTIFSAVSTLGHVLSDYN
jgi:hypothetical protein